MTSILRIDDVTFVGPAVRVLDNLLAAQSIIEAGATDILVVDSTDENGQPQRQLVVVSPTSKVSALLKNDATDGSLEAIDRYKPNSSDLFSKYNPGWDDAQHA